MAVREGRIMPWTGGELILETSTDPKTCLPRLNIVRADPVVWVMDEVVEEMRKAPDHLATVKDWVVKIHGDNQTVIYRLMDYDHATECWRAQWPD